MASSRIALALVAGVAATLVACGAAPTAGKSPGPAASGTGGASSSPVASSSLNPAQIDFCTLLTAAEASQLAGTPLTHTQGGGAGNTAPCVYASGVAISVAVKLVLFPDAASAQTVYGAQVRTFRQKGCTVTELSGLGDAAAVFQCPPPTGGSVDVVKGSVLLVIATTRVIPSVAAFQTAAATALSRF